MPSKKPKKYKLLLDEGLPLPRSYPKINDFHDVSHVALTQHRSKEDADIYKIAEKENRVPVVFNIKDYKSLILPISISIIYLSPNLTNEQADSKIIKALKRLTRAELKGCLISVTKSGVTIKRVIKD